VGLDYKSYLQKELVNRCKKNTNYSLRAFDKNLGVTPSILSRVLSGKRPITKQFMAKTAASLNLSIKELEKFSLFTASEQAKPERNFETLALESLEAISDWTHYAVFELLDTKGFKSDAKWMAQRLGVSVHEVHTVLERLTALEIIHKDKKGNYKKLKSSIATTGHNFTVVAFRKLQKQFLELATKALDEVPMEQRDQSTMVMAIDPKLIHQAKEKLKNFRYEMHDFLQSTKNLSEVYSLSLALFPMTQLDSKKNKKQENVK
jgi:hypothetical protein